MQNPMQTKTSMTNEHPAKRGTANQMFELTDVDLQSVSGGLNPQPLPPCQRDRY